MTTTFTYKIFKATLEEMDSTEKQENYLNKLGSKGWLCFRISVHGDSVGKSEYLFYCVQQVI